MNKKNNGNNTGNTNPNKSPKSPGTKIQKRGFNLLNAPGAIGSFTWTWLGVCGKHLLGNNCQTWYRMVSPFLILAFAFSVINITDLVFFDIFWAAVTVFVLNSGLFPEEREYLSTEWDETIRCITGKEETISEGIEKATTILKSEIVEADFHVEEIPPPPLQTTPSPKTTKTLYQNLADEFGESLDEDSDFTK